jgi:putative Ca2+/H+ antiporter (TMEM165/GDT1 family)
MPAFFLSFVVCVVVTMAGREQLRVARLSGVLGARMGLFLAVGISSIATSAIAAWAGMLLVPTLNEPAKSMVIAIALLLAALQLAVLRAKPAPKEPTWSFAAILIVLIIMQICDAVRLVMLALALQTSVPIPVAAGGALGSGMALLIAWRAGDEWEMRVPHRILSQGFAAVLLLAALLIGASVH